MRSERNFVVTLSIYLTALLLLFTVQILASLGCFNALSDQALEVIFSVVPQLGIMFGLPLLVLWLHKRQQKKPFKNLCQELSWRKIPGKTILLAFFLGICLYLLNLFVASVFANILQSFGYQYPTNENVFHGKSGLLITLVLTAVLPGFCEEFLHRGVLLSGMRRKFGNAKAVMLVSLLFGLMHLNVGQFFYATVLGWFLCMAVLTSQSLWVGMIIHFTNNALSVYWSYADELNLPGIAAFNSLLSNPLILIVMVVLVFIGVGEVMRYLARENYLKQQDLYTVRYMATQHEFNASNFDQVKDALKKVLQQMPTWKATFAYIETYDAPEPVRPLERALLTTIIVLGAAITLFSFVWGTW